MKQSSDSYEGILPKYFMEPGDKRVIVPRGTNQSIIHIFLNN